MATTDSSLDNKDILAPLRTGGNLKVGISSFASWMLGVGTIIGSMAWLIHGPMLARSGTAACLFAWLLAGVLSFPLTLILMELSSMFPTAGGPYVFKYYALKRLFPQSGELLGFLTGWLFWSSLVVGLACMANGLTNLLASQFWGAASSSPIWFGPLVILLLFGTTTMLNFLPVAQASGASNLFTIMKLAMVGFFLFLVFHSPQWSFTYATNFSNPMGGTDFLANVSSVLMLAMAGFSFLELSCCVSSETVDAKRNVPRALLLTLFSITAIYLSMCLAISVSAPYVLTADGSTLVVPGTPVQATCPAMAGWLGGAICGQIFSACVVASIVGCSFAALLGAARVSYSMAQTKLFPAQFGALDPVSKVPNYSLCFQFWFISLIAVIANLVARTNIFPDAYAFLGDTFGFMYAFVAILYGFCLLSLRYTDPAMERPFRIGRSGNTLAWLMAITSITIWSYAALVCVHWMEQLTGLTIILAGLPVYWYCKLQAKSK